MIADSQIILAESLSIIFSGEQDIEVIATAKSVADAVEKCRKLLPDMALIDIELPEASGIEASVVMKKCCPDIKIAIMSSIENAGYVTEALKNDADAYLLKNINPVELVQMVRIIYLGNRIICGAAGAYLARDLKKFDNAPPVKRLWGLKSEDAIIVRMIANGKSNDEIAYCMGLAKGTVKNKISRIIRAVGVDTRAQLIKKAAESGMISLRSSNL